MDAPVDLDIDAHPISRGRNPFLDRCVHCSAPRLDSQEEDEGFEYLDLQLDGNAMISSLENSQPFSSINTAAAATILPLLACCRYFCYSYQYNSSYSYYSYLSCYCLICFVVAETLTCQSHRMQCWP
ncbi:hypothetical protein ElyMa_003742000 [Elysia marginata]|uniref:Uncharacterized protein n=1 Tax=Elysia marginata TaxID=1093978 RepID=A0AAV4F5X0_9GAST|nr:hypothetical protein ElyMa_003742000 [Elysia marginata]